MNTAQYMPYESVAPIIIGSDASPELHFFSGTGFFVKFNPYRKIYFVTAKHCTINSSNEPMGSLKIKLNSDQSCNKAVPFVFQMTGQLVNDDFPEDIIVYEVGELSDEDREKLERRALPLSHQEDVELIIRTNYEKREKTRILGYPSTSKEIDYENNVAKVQPRGIVGTVTSATPNMRWITVEELNWKEGSISGFSGSPVLALIPTSSGSVQVIPIGVVSTGNENLFKFISINVATDLIAYRLSNPDLDATEGKEEDKS